MTETHQSADDVKKAITPRQSGPTSIHWWEREANEALDKCPPAVLSPEAAQVLERIHIVLTVPPVAMQDYNCFGLVEFVTGVTDNLAYRPVAMEVGECMSIEVALRRFALPFVFQLNGLFQDENNGVVHTGLVIGNDVDGDIEVFHKIGRDHPAERTQWTKIKERYADTRLSAEWLARARAGDLPRDEHWFDGRIPPLESFAECTWFSPLEAFRAEYRFKLERYESKIAAIIARNLG